MIKTIVLDLDGPIFDGRSRHYQCYSDILKENGFTPIPAPEYWQMKRQRIDRHLQLTASGAAGIYDRFLQAWLERIEEEKYLSLDRLQPGAVEKLREWKAAGIKLFLVTMRNKKENLQRQLASFDLVPFFDQVVSVGTDGEGNKKATAAEAYLDKASRGSVLWIGDTEEDIRAAHQLGVKVCAVDCGLRTREYLASLCPDFLCHDLKAINLPNLELL